MPTSECSPPPAGGADFFRRTDFWSHFQHHSVRVGANDVHYVAGGTGAPVLLIPGWPQSWYAWRYVMAALRAAGRRVVAVDPRGMGESDAPVGPYDLGTVAAEIHAVAQAGGLLADGPIDVAGHDVGAWIAYAYGADWPGDIRRLALLDALVPGLSAPRADVDPAEAARRGWHFAFNQLDDLPEILIPGREQAFLTWLFRAKAARAWTITADDIAVYARQLAAPGALRAVGAYYRAAFSTAGVAANRRRAETPLTMPVLALGAEFGVGDSMAAALRALAGAVTGTVVAGAGHYLPEEAADDVSRALLEFFSSAGPDQPSTMKKADQI